MPSHHIGDLEPSKMRVRAYHAYTITVLVLFVVGIASSEVAPTGEYRPDAWAEISIALGASILALVGIVTSILTSRENDRRTEISDLLSELSIKFRDKSKPENLTEVYNGFQEKIKSRLQEMQPLRYSDGVVGIFSFVFFVTSALTAIWGSPFKWIIGTFLVGLAFLLGYITYYMEQCVSIDKISKIAEPKGELKLLSLNVDGDACSFERKEKDVFFSLRQEPKKIELEVEYKGNARNGFLDALVKYTNGSFSFIPDSNTYLSDFVFTMGHRLTLLEGGKFDTGVLQLKDQQQKLPFEIILRSEEKPKLRSLRDPRIFTELTEHCSPPENFIVDFVEVGLYEDPSFRPKYKRRQVDYIRLRPQRQKKEA